MLYTIMRSPIAGFQTRQSLVLENLALRHQVQVLKRNGKRPKIRKQDRALGLPQPIGPPTVTESG
jgi:hypothetical protein